MELVNQLLVLGQTWTGATLALSLLFLTFIFQRVLPTEQRARTIAPLVFLALAFVSGLSATVALKLGAYTIWGVFSLLNLLCLIIGITSLIGIVIFDLALTHTRFRVPSLIRNLIHNQRPSPHRLHHLVSARSGSAFAADHFGGAHRCHWSRPAKHHR